MFSFSDQSLTKLLQLLGLNYRTVLLGFSDQSLTKLLQQKTKWWKQKFFFVSVTKVLRSYFNLTAINVLNADQFQWPKSYEAASTTTNNLKNKTMKVSVTKVLRSCFNNQAEQRLLIEILFQWPKSYEVTSTGSWPWDSNKLACFSDQSLTKLLQRHLNRLIESGIMFQWPKSYEATSTFAFVVSQVSGSVSVTKVLRSYFNEAGTGEGTKGKFQWPKSYEAASTNFNDYYRYSSKKFQWPKSYEATSTLSR